MVGYEHACERAGLLEEMVTSVSLQICENLE